MEEEGGRTEDSEGDRDERRKTFRDFREVGGGYLQLKS